MAQKDNFSEKKMKKEKEKEKDHDNKEKKIEKRNQQQQKRKKFHGERLLGPQASLRVTPCPLAPNHTRGEVVWSASQIENNFYKVIRTRDLCDITCTRWAPTITSRPSRNSILYWY